MSKLAVRLILGVLLAAMMFIGSAARVAVAEDGGCADPNTVQPAAE
jgi:hypothetical protein